MSLTKDQWLRETGGFPLKEVLFAKVVAMQRPPKIRHAGPKVVFDIETARISASFHRAKTDAQRIKCAPAPSIACAYSTESRRFSFYRPHQFGDLLRLLRRAGEVITFNGEDFDFYVLAKTLRIRLEDLGISQSTDLFRLVKESMGVWASLHNLAVVNLGEGKHTAGHAIPNLDAAAISAACRSDVHQLYRLYRHYTVGTLRVPLLSLSAKDYRHMPFRGVCPCCRDVASIVELQPDISEMTDGQALPYLSGEVRAARCTTCGAYFTTARM